MTFTVNTLNMVDCGNIRCFQERRSFRKELLSWSKKVPLLVGLEAVAAELGGRKKVTKLLEPFNCLESKEVHDWKPQENCFYCKNRIQLLFVRMAHGRGHLCCMDIFLALVNKTADAIEKTDSKEGGRILRDHPSLRHLSDVLPFCPQFYTSNFGRDILLDIKTAPPEPEIEVPVPQPAPKPNIELKIPNLPATSKQPKKEIMSNGKKGYTEEELTAAVSDIRSGKLGTRRAASLYGIPRSTLRNKIFKMDVDEAGNLTRIIDDDASNDGSNPQEPPLQLSDLIQISTLQYLAPIAMPFIIKQEVLNEESEWEKRLQHMRHKHNLNNSSMDHYMEKALQHTLKPFLCELIKKLAQERFEMERNASKLKTSESNDTGFYHSSVLRALNFNTVNNNQSSSGSSSPSLSISVPLYTLDQPTISGKSSTKEENGSKGFHSHFKYENTKIGDTLKDIIVKTISEKVRCKLEASDFGGFSSSSDEAEKMKAKETIMSAFSIPDKSCSPPKKIKRESDIHTDSHKSYNTVSASTQVKKTRPKRGQYRKYNSQLLTEAVRAVQRGEMSVHRAGSYYGVPHSTLEYKVKERHLLRQKKIKEQQQLKQQKEEEEKKASKDKKEEPVEPSTSNKTDSSKLATDLLSLSTPKSLAGPAWLPPFAGPTPFESAAALGLFGSGFALSTPASELLRKLQHKVQSKSDFTEEEFDFNDKRTVGVPSEGYLYIN